MPICGGGRGGCFIAVGIATVGVIFVGSPDDPLYVEKARAKYLFTLKRNTYRAHQISHEFIVEFVTHSDTKETMVLFNDIHGQLGVYNMKGQLVHRDEQSDKFIRNLEIINEKYIIAYCWFWNSTNVDLLYNIDELLTNPKYCPISIWCEENDIIYEIIDNEKTIDIPSPGNASACLILCLLCTNLSGPCCNYRSGKRELSVPDR